jgi:uncharacterized protein YyaL (SSP411 family)
MAARLLNVAEEGNFREEATGKSSGTNILHLSRPLDEFAGELEMTPEAVNEAFERVRGRLLEVRSNRIRPHLDDKVLADWNGMMVAALAKAGSALGREDMVETARRAMAFILGTLRDEDGRLMHRYRDGEAAIKGHLDDYAFVVWGLLELYEATFDPAYLRTAIGLNTVMLDRFWDEDGGGLHLTPDDGEELLVRQKEVYDGAMPSGNSVAMLNLLRLSHLTGDPDLTQRASELGQAFSSDVSSLPMGFTHLMGGLDFALGGAREVVIVGDPDAEDTRAMLDALRSTYSPNKVILLKAPDGGEDGILELAPFLKDHHMLGGKATAYVCQDHFCKNPTVDVDEMLQALE